MPIKLSAIKRIENRAHVIGDVVSLAQGIPSLRSHELIREEVIKAINAGKVDRYSLSAGLPELRDLVFKKLNLDTTLHEVIVTAGAIEALSAIFLTICNEGDEVITFSPYYSSYQQTVEISGARIVCEPLQEELGWRPNLKSLRNKINSKTKAILLCHPHNPTGVVFTKQELQEIGEIALEYNILILSDNVYKNFYYDVTEPYYSLDQDPRFSKNLITITSFSKDFSLSGWRIGFMFGHPDVLKDVYAVHDALVNCAPVVSQYAAIAALTHEEEILPDMLPQYAKNRQIMGDYLYSLREYLDYVVPEGSYFFFPRIKGLKDSEKFCFDMLENAKVAAVPGGAFGPDGEGHIRLCFGRSESDIVEGMERFKAYLQAYFK